MQSMGLYFLTRSISPVSATTVLIERSVSSCVTLDWTELPTTFIAPRPPRTLCGFTLALSFLPKTPFDGVNATVRVDITISENDASQEHK